MRPRFRARPGGNGRDNCSKTGYNPAQSFRRLQSCRALLSAVHEQADVLRPELRALVEARVAVVEAGKARPFDRAALETAMTGFRAAADRMLVSVQKVIADTLEARASSQ